MLPELSTRKRMQRRKLPTTEKLGKKHYRRRMNWLLDFANAEIFALPKGKFIALLYEALDFLYGDQVQDKSEVKNICVDTPLNRKGLQRIRDEVISNILELLDQYHKTRQSHTPIVSAAGTVTYNLQVARGTISLVPYGKAMRYDRRANFSLKDEYQRLDTGKHANDQLLKKLYRRINSEHHVFFTHFYDEDLERTILLKLVPLLEKIPVETIKQCPKCRRFYLATRRKTDDRCRKCLQKAHTYNWRSKHPEKYNAGQRERRKRRSQAKREQPRAQA